VRHYEVSLSAAASAVLTSAVLIGKVSKRAVIAKRRRLGLFAFAPREKAWTAAEGPSRRSSRSADGLTNLPTRALPIMDVASPPDADPKPLPALGRRACVWPLGAAEAEGDHRTLFCGAPKQEG
jgi:hypothetical protein